GLARHSDATAGRGDGRRGVPRRAGGAAPRTGTAVLVPRRRVALRAGVAVEAGQPGGAPHGALRRGRRRPRLGGTGRAPRAGRDAAVPAAGAPVPAVREVARPGV